MQQGWNPQGGAPGAPQQYGQPQGYGQPPQPQAGYGQPGYGQAPQGGTPGPGAQGPAAPGYAPPGQGGGIQSKMPGFVGGLFDFSFTNFITTKVIKVLYGIWILGCVALVLAGFFGAISQWFFSYRARILEGLVMLVLTPIAAALYLILGRVYMEVLIVLFKIAENLGELNRKTKDQTTSS